MYSTPTQTYTYTLLYRMSDLIVLRMSKTSTSYRWGFWFVNKIISQHILASYIYCTIVKDLWISQIRNTTVFRISYDYISDSS